VINIYFQVSSGQGDRNNDVEVNVPPKGSIKQGPRNIEAPVTSSRVSLHVLYLISLLHEIIIFPFVIVIVYIHTKYNSDIACSNITGISV
jgi:hypothetical protein